MTLAVITNRLSTRNRRAEQWIDPLLAGEPGVTHFAVEDVAQLDSAIGRCAAVGATSIVVNGGDGTAGLIFGKLLNASPYAEPPTLALLPGGKTNMTAAAWSLRGEAPDALQAVLALHRTGTLGKHARPRAIMRVHDGDAPARYGTFFGAADIVEGILFCRRHIYPLNMPNAVSHAAAMGLLLWRSLFAPAGVKPIRISHDGREGHNGRLFVFAATTLDRLILDLRPSPESGEGELIYTSVEHRPGAILSALPDVLARRLRSGNGRSVGRAHDLRLRFAGAYTIDGEMYEAAADRDVTLDSRSTLRFIQLPA